MSLMDQYKAIIGTLCPKHCVGRLYVLGSALSHSFSDHSDIELLVGFSDVSLTDHADNYFGFKFASEDAFGRPVDLEEQQTLWNPFYKLHIEASRQLVYAA